jgi:hypothetical protein
MKIKLREERLTVADHGLRQGGTFDMDFFENQIQKMMENHNAKGSMLMNQETNEPTEQTNLLMKFDANVFSL